MGKELLRHIPPVHEILEQEEIKGFQRELGRDFVTEEINIQQDNLRQEILSGQNNDLIYNEKEKDGYRDKLRKHLVQKVKNGLKEKTSPKLKPVINATGTVIHTNLGRAPLAAEVCEELFELARGYNNLELELETGERGSRYAHIEEIIMELTGAEGALVVNNNAAAVMLVLHNLASNKEVIISRGELVEIGGSFRVPDVMKQSGAILKEVGTTNKTHLKDYSEAVSEETAMLLSVHTSNYRIIGFTEKPSLEAMSDLAKEKEIPFVKDLGSGLFIDLEGYDEPTVGEVIASDVDLVTFSGDKLLGGPQCGVIAGKKEYIERLKKDQLTRALRMDKLTMKALESTLRLYLNPDKAREKIPVLAALTVKKEELEKKAKEIASNLREVISADFEVDITEETSRVGGGAMPEVDLPTWVVVLKSSTKNLEKLSRDLRNYEPPALLRFKNEYLLIDPRTLLGDEDKRITEIIGELTNKF